MRVNSQHGSNTLTVEFIDLEKAMGDLEAHARERSNALWAMGDILERIFRSVNASAGIRREFARQGVSMARVARQLGLTSGRLTALRLTASTFAAKERHQDLTWEHHYLIARNLGHETVAVRRRWLRDAAKHQWSISQLRAKLRARKPRVPGASAEERVNRLRRQLAEAEAQLDGMRQDKPHGSH